MNTVKRQRIYTILGWGITLVGCALWTYGYFVRGSLAFLNWSTFSPQWIADYLPNWQSETGLFLTFIGSVPKYIAQMHSERRRD